MLYSHCFGTSLRRKGYRFQCTICLSFSALRLSYLVQGSYRTLISKLKGLSRVSYGLKRTFSRSLKYQKRDKQDAQHTENEKFLGVRNLHVRIYFKLFWIFALLIFFYFIAVNKVNSNHFTNFEEFHQLSFSRSFKCSLK